MDEARFEKGKNEANAMLKETMDKFDNRSIARLIFTERMNKVILMYDGVHTRFSEGPKAGQEDPKKVSSIEKNKAFTY